MDIGQKKIYILNKLYDTKYHNETINFIITHNIKYTENNNNILINLSVLNDDLVDKLYNILVNDNFVDNTYNYDKLINNDEIYEVSNNSKDKIKKEEYKDILLKDFTEDEKKLILLSKKYKFE